MNDIGIIIQARTGSARLPGKTLLPFFEDKSILDIIIENIQNHFQEKIIIATTQNTQDEKIVEIAKRNKVLWFRGNEENVLKRFIDAAKNFGLNTIIRICGDNPFISSS
jgi:spore coat polysaccharide biosynthesis protein SpsF (cytidylyltransferase family)